MTCKLYYHPQSNFSRKIRILLMEKNVDYELEAITLSAKPEYFLKISPIGKVPVFVDEDGTIIWDSSLIAEYLEEKYPQPHFCPQTFQEKITCRKWEEMADTFGDHVIDLWIQGLFNQGTPINQPYRSAGNLPFAFCLLPLALLNQPMDFFSKPYLLINYFNLVPRRTGIYPSCAFLHSSKP